MTATPEPHEKIEDLLCDGLKIIVHRDGFRYGTDSILLANYVRAGRGASVVELCSGSGVVSILLSAKTHAARITGIEINESMAALANRSVVLNGIGERVGFICGDVREIRGIMRAGSAGVVVANPPYLRRGSGTGSRGADVDIARREICCELEDITAAGGWLLGQGGIFYIVYRPERLVDLFCAMRASGIEPKELQPAGATAEKPPSLVLVQGKKGAAPGLRYMKQIVIGNHIQ